MPPLLARLHGLGPSKAAAAASSLLLAAPPLDPDVQHALRVVHRLNPDQFRAFVASLVPASAARGPSPATSEPLSDSFALAMAKPHLRVPLDNLSESTLSSAHDSQPWSFANSTCGDMDVSPTAGQAPTLPGSGSGGSSSSSNSGHLDRDPAVAALGQGAAMLCIMQPRIRDQWARQRFIFLQQCPCKEFAVNIIREIDPKKQNLFPYKGKRATPQRPPYWPDDINVRHDVSPSHLKKDERVNLLVHFLFLPAVNRDYYHTWQDGPGAKKHQRSWARMLVYAAERTTLRSDGPKRTKASAPEAEGHAVVDRSKLEVSEEEMVKINARAELLTHMIHCAAEVEKAADGRHGHDYMVKLRPLPAYYAAKEAASEQRHRKRKTIPRGGGAKSLAAETAGSDTDEDEHDDDDDGDDDDDDHVPMPQPSHAPSPAPVEDESVYLSDDDSSSRSLTGSRLAAVRPPEKKRRIQPPLRLDIAQPRAVNEGEYYQHHPPSAGPDMPTDSIIPNAGFAVAPTTPRRRHMLASIHAQQQQQQQQQQMHQMHIQPLARQQPVPQAMGRRDAAMMGQPSESSGPTQLQHPPVAQYAFNSEFGAPITPDQHASMSLTSPISAGPSYMTSAMSSPWASNFNHMTYQPPMAMNQAFFPDPASFYAPESGCDIQGSRVMSFSESYDGMMPSNC